MCELTEDMQREPTHDEPCEPTLDERRELAQRLLALDCFDNQQVFQVTLGHLPKDIRNRFVAGATLTLSALNLVNAVLAVQGGLDDLTRLVQFLESGARALDAYLGYVWSLRQRYPKLARLPEAPSPPPPPTEDAATDRRSPSPRADTVNLEEERKAVAAVLAGADPDTRLVTLNGASGFGKTHLVHVYRGLASDFGVRWVHISLKSGLSPHRCIERMVQAFGANGFEELKAFQAERSGRQDSAEQKREWYAQLTELFYRELESRRGAARLVVLMDGLERADTPFSLWLKQAFLPPLRERFPVLVVLTGRPECGVDRMTVEGIRCRHVDLRGLTFRHAMDYIVCEAIGIGEEQLRRFWVNRLGTPDLPMPPIPLMQFINGARR